MSTAEIPQRDMLQARVRVEGSRELKKAISQLILPKYHAMYFQPQLKSALQNHWYLYTRHPVLLPGDGSNLSDESPTARVIERYRVGIARRHRGTDMYMGHMALSSFFGTKDGTPNDPDSAHLLMRLALSPEDYAYRQLVQPPFEAAAERYLHITQSLPGKYVVPLGEEREQAYEAIRQKLQLGRAAVTNALQPLDRTYYAWHVAVETNPISPPS